MIYFILAAALLIWIGACWYVWHLLDNAEATCNRILADLDDLSAIFSGMQFHLRNLKGQLADLKDAL